MSEMVDTMAPVQQYVDNYHSSLTSISLMIAREHVLFESRLISLPTIALCARLRTSRGAVHGLLGERKFERV